MNRKSMYTKPALIRLFILTLSALLCLATAQATLAEDKIELKTIKIKGNKELPKILYVVPWQEAQRTKQKTQKLKLHNFFGELYQPIMLAAPKTPFD